jgi:hypothetical protein
MGLKQVIKQFIAVIISKCLNSIGKGIIFRFGLINQQALGHQVFDTEVNYLESAEKKTSRSFDCWYVLGESKNEIISEFWSANLITTQNSIALKFYSALESASNNSRNLLSRRLGAADGDVLDRFPPQFSFSTGQMRIVEHFLSKLKIDLSLPIVTICLRDDEYYRLKSDKRNMKIHSHRNVDVSSYLKGVNLLLELGCSVIRIGRVAEKPLPISHKNFLDLPFEKDVSVESIGVKNRELLELGIFNLSKFCVSTGLGSD